MATSDPFLDIEPGNNRQFPFPPFESEMEAFHFAQGEGGVN